MSDTNPFATAEAWEVNTGYQLGVGDHVVRIVAVEDGTSRNANPQIELRFENANGSIRHWETYSETFLAKVVALFDAAGAQRPQEGEFNPADKCRITQKAIDRLYNKEVGIVVRDEPDFKDPTRMRARVQGYVPKDRITADMPADTSGLPPAGLQTEFAGVGSSQKPGEPEIPFVHDEFPLDFEPWRSHANR